MNRIESFISCFICVKVECVPKLNFIRCIWDIFLNSHWVHENLETTTSPATDKLSIAIQGSGGRIGGRTEGER